MMTLSHLGSDDAEEPEILQTRRDTDGNTDRMRAGSGRTSTQPGGTSILLGPPRSLHTTLTNSMEVKKKTLNTQASLVLVGRGQPAHCLLHSWQSLLGTSGQHVAPITILKACARLFLSTGWLGVGVVSFGDQPYARGRVEGPGLWAGFREPAVC